MIEKIKYFQKIRFKNKNGYINEIVGKSQVNCTKINIQRIDNFCFSIDKMLYLGSQNIEYLHVNLNLADLRLLIHSNDKTVHTKVKSARNQLKQAKKDYLIIKQWGKQNYYLAQIEEIEEKETEILIKIEEITKL